MPLARMLGDDILAQCTWKAHATIHKANYWVLNPAANASTTLLGTRCTELETRTGLSLTRRKLEVKNFANLAINSPVEITFRAKITYMRSFWEKLSNDQLQGGVYVFFREMISVTIYARHKPCEELGGK